MPVPARSPLGASTLNRKWFLDVNIGTISVPEWIGVFGMLDFKPVYTPTLQDDSDFDSEGAKSKTVTAYEWGVDAKLSRKVVEGAPTTYDPGQEFLRLAGAQQGEGNSVPIRFYEMSPDGPRVEAYAGNVAVSWSPDGGAMDALDSVALTGSGQGKRTAITHPGEAAISAPVIDSITPGTDAAAGGELVTITGSGFTGATAVTFGAVEAADFNVVSPFQIAAIVPAQVAGTVAVTVTTPAGTSPSVDFIYTV